MPAESKIKPRVVVDTNVIVSGLTFKGKPREILDLARRGEIQLCISPFILNEMSEVLKEDFGWSEEEIREVAGELKARAILVEPEINISIIKEKEDDNRILECALAGKVQYLISGDKRHLLPLKNFRGIEVLSPTEFLKKSL